MYRRTLFIFGVKAFFFGIIFFRLIYLQILSYRKYLNLSNLNRYRIGFVPAKRGNILDRNNVVVAYSRVSYNAVFNPVSVSDKISVIRRFFIILNRKNIDVDGIIAKYLKKIKNYNSETPLVLFEDLTYDEIARIEFNNEHLHGVRIQEMSVRVYPFKNYFSNITGYIGSPTLSQLEKVNNVDKKLYKDYGFKIGQIGIEGIKDGDLRGQYGIVLKEVNATGETLNQINHSHSVSGFDIKLTIDSRVQEYVGQLFGDISGSIIVGDVQNGDIIAMHSSPSYDPNDMIKGIDKNAWTKLNNTKLGYLTNKAILGIYQPGSTFKPITAIAGLKNGFDPNRIVECTGEYEYGNRIFHCHKKEGHGKLNMIEAVACSCNVYFYTIANTLTIDQLTDTAKLFGFGEYVDLGIGRESKGLIPDPSWKYRVLHKRWLLSETMMLAIGQTYTGVTLMQLNNMISKIATGLLMRNRLFFDASPNRSIEMPIKKEYLDIVRRGIKLSFTHKFGTSSSGSEYQEKYKMSGKTGTAQVVSKRFTMKEMYSGTIPKEQLPHGLYVGYAPYGDPKFSVAVMIEHGMSGIVALRYAEKTIAKVMDLYEEDLLKSSVNN